MVGSACFALGAFPPYASWVEATATGITFFVGSLFFTSAAALQFQQSATRLDWWAGLVQFAGTLLFNRSTFQALHQNLTASEANRHVWVPDALGSIAFLVASAIACVAVRRASRASPREPVWWAAWLNMLGSVAFGVSAVASYTFVDTDTLRNAERANLGTFVGALCFFAGAALILPRTTQVGSGRR
jgi:cytochrome bd-type quinol oxidase subunit 2